MNQTRQTRMASTVAEVRSVLVDVAARWPATPDLAYRLDACVMRDINGISERIMVPWPDIKAGEKILYITLWRGQKVITTEHDPEYAQIVAYRDLVDAQVDIGTLILLIGQLMVELNKSSR